MKHWAFDPGALMRRCRQNKFAIIGSKSDTDDPQGAQVSAHVDPAQITANIGDMKMRVAALRATRGDFPHKAPEKTPTGTGDNRTLAQLVAELNSLSNAIDQTVWFRENYQSIKVAQARERCA